MAAFKANRITRTYTQRLVAPPDNVFPLLCPVREKDWAGEWDYEMIYSQSGLAELDCTFKTQHPGTPDTIWVMTRYEPENLYVEFLNITPDLRTAKIDITLTDNLDGTTTAQITYTYTALSERGNHLLADVTEEHFDWLMEMWEQQMNYYLETGQILKIHTPR